jgi:hypothetical protein
MKNGGTRDTPIRWRIPISMAIVALMLVSPTAVALPGIDFDRPPNWFEDHVYHHHADLTTELKELQEDYPQYVDLTSIGSSVRGRALWNIRITDPQVPAEGKTRIYIDGEHHGNEYLGGELCILLIRHLLEDQNDADVQELLRTTIIWVTPMLNPDGNARDTRGNVNGVDLNRHYPFEFTPGGSHGDAPGVEPEVAGNIAFMDKADLDLYITMHTGIVRMLYPWGYIKEPPPDLEMYESLRDFSEDNGIIYAQSSVELYIATGSAKDYGYGGLGVPSFTYEVDGSQTSQISRREDIASRLSDELSLLMDFLIVARSMTAHLNATVTDVDVSPTGDGADVKVTVEVDNPSLAHTNISTVTVEVHRNGHVIETHETMFNVTAGNMTTVKVGFELEGEGDYELRTWVENPTLLVANASVDRFVIATTAITVEPSGFASGASTIGLLLILIAVGAALLLWAWKRGWRPGWALKRVQALVIPLVTR